MREYQTQDGIILRNVPDDIPDEQIKARIQQERELLKKGSDSMKMENPSEINGRPLEPQKIDQTRGMGDYEKRAFEISKSDITGMEKELQSTALGLDYIYDTAANEVSEFIAEKPKRFIGNTMKSLGNALGLALKTPTGIVGIKALKEGKEQWADFEQKNPRWAADMKAVGIIGSTALMGSRPAAKLTKKAFFGRNDYLSDLLKPIKIKDINIKKNIRTEGLKGNIVYKPSLEDKEIIKVLDSIDELKTGYLPARTYEIIDSRIATEANKLKEKLIASGKSVNNNEIKLTLNRAINNFDRQYDKSKRLSKKERFEFIDDSLDRIGNPQTTAELLEARKAADKRFRFFSNDRRMKGELIPTREELKWRSVRDSLNGLLEMKEPGYKADINRQHLMYKSLDSIEDKVYKQIADEGRTFMQKVEDKVPLPTIRIRR